MNGRVKQFFQKILCGVAIGVGFVLPGVSGGVLAVSMGLFEPMIEAIKGILKRFKESFLYLLPIGLGGVAGVLLTSIILKAVIARYEAETLCLFIGFMLGSLPTLWHESLTERHPGFRAKDLLFMLAGFAFMMIFMFLDTSGTAAQAALAGRALPIPLALGAGAVMAVGIIVPGLSCSFLLEYLGLYKSIVTAIADVYIPTLFFCGLGFLIPAVLMVMLISFLFKRYRAPSYLTVMGISVGSMVLIVPSLIGRASWVCLPLMAVGLVTGLLQARAQIRRKEQRGSAEELDLGAMVKDIRRN